jgi:hypothetical protein
MQLSILVKQLSQAALLSLIVLTCLGSSPTLALDDVFDCDFFTGHCTGGGPFDEPHDSEPDFPDPPEDPTPPQPPKPVPPPVTPPSQPAPDPIEPPPICDRRPSLPQCN